MPVLGQGLVLNDQRGNMFMEEVHPHEHGPALVRQSLWAAYKSVCGHRLAEAERWIMYGEIKGSMTELIKASDDAKYLAQVLSGFSAREGRSAVSAASADLVVLRALMQIRLHRPVEAYAALKSLVKDYPHYGSINQIKARIAVWEENQPGSNSSSAHLPISEVGILKWKNDGLPIRVYLPDEADSVTVAGYMVGDCVLLREAFEAWSKASRGKVCFKYVDCSSPADIVCSWVDDPEKLGGRDIAGNCLLKTDEQGYLKAAKISVLTCRIVCNGSSGFDKAWRDKYLGAISAHEVGHSLGLKHSPDNRDVMYASVHAPKGLTCRDIDALQQLYTVSADDFSKKGFLLMGRHEYRQALVHFDKAILLDPADLTSRECACECLSRLALLSLNKADDVEAISLLRRAQSLFLDDMSTSLRLKVLESLQYAYERSGKLKEAQDVQKQLDSSSLKAH